MYPNARESFADMGLKLKANYGKEKFPDEKLALIWEELREFSPKQIRNVCDTVMGESTYAPNLYAFREKASILREKIRTFERQQERQDAEDFWKGTYHTEDVKMIVRTIKDRMEGRCDDRTWKEFQDFLKAHADSTEPVKCKKCDDTGVFHDDQYRNWVCNQCEAWRPR